MDEFLTREKAADFLKISTRTLDRYVKSRVLPTHKKGRRSVFLKSDLDLLEKTPGHKAEIAEENEGKMLIAESNENLGAIARLLEKMHEELRRKEEVIFRLNFELGAAREREKASIPLLEAGKKQEETIKVLQERLFSVRSGRTLFFGLFAASLGAIAILANALFFL